MSLSCFLAENVQMPGVVEFVPSKRFLDAEKKPVKWKIKPITSSEDEKIRKSCMKRVQIPGKRGQYTQETDYNQYTTKLAVACTAYPDLHDKALQDSYKVMGAEELLKTMLLPGEYADYLAKIQETNGFDISMEEMADEAKN